jgi:hypothetical protein
MSALPPKADMCSVEINVCFVPEADINHHLFSAVVIALIRFALRARLRGRRLPVAPLIDRVDALCYSSSIRNLLPNSPELNLRSPR